MARLDFFPSEELIQQYRQVFSSSNGMEVLNHILFDLGVFQPITEGPEDVALKNYGIRLIQILSGGDVEEASLKEFTKRIMRQPLKREE